MDSGYSRSVRTRKTPLKPEALQAETSVDEKLYKYGL